MPRRLRAAPSRWSVPLDRRLGYRINMLGAALSQHMLLRIQREFRLNLAEYRVLNVLGALASPSIKDIARHSQLDKAQATRALPDLIKRGLVTQTVGTDDRRLRVIELTAAGRKIVSHFGPLQLARQRRLERRLTAAELRIFWRVIAALSEEAEQMLAEEMQLGGQRRRAMNADAHITAP